MPTTSGPPGRSPRVRDPELHRRAILDAAARVFADHGYTGATLRDIARRAGVTHGLVLRHFGSKEKLFIAAVPGTRDIADLADGPPESLASRLARAFVHRMEQQDGADPFVALVRSAGGGTDTAAQLYTAMQEHTTETYRRLLGEHALEHRVPFLAALLVGVTVSRYVIRAGSLADMSAERFTQDLTSAIEALLATEATGRE